MSRIGIAIGACAALVGVAVVVAASAPSIPEREGPALDDAEILDRAGLEVTPEMRRHSAVNNAIWLGGFLWTVGSCWLLLRSGLAAKLRSIAQSRVESRFWSRTFAAFLIFTALTILLFPLELLAGFIVPHYFELSNLTLGAWLVEGLKGYALMVGVGSLLTAGAFAAIDRFPRNWWFALWVASVPLTILLVFIAPIVISPIFNDFEPLDDPGLEQRLLDLAEGVGIEGSRVYQVDKSKQTKTMNAYVTGVGSTKRIVMWDTLLEKMEEDEVVFVMAHEMGHYVLHHLWRSLLVSVLFSLLLYAVGSGLIERGVERRRDAWKLEGMRDVAILPWVILVMSILGFLASPALAAMSRSMEHEADVFALEHTGLGEPGAGAFAALAAGSRVDPSPHPLIRFLRYSHPPLIERMRLALEWPDPPSASI